MTAPRYTDADVYRLMYGDGKQPGAHLEWELDVSLVEPGDCRCCASDPDVRGCRDPYILADGLVKLSCTNGERVIDYLTDKARVTGQALGRELLRRLAAAAERARQEAA